MMNVLDDQDVATKQPVKKHNVTKQPAAKHHPAAKPAAHARKGVAVRRVSGSSHGSAHAAPKRTRKITAKRSAIKA